MMTDDGRNAGKLTIRGVEYTLAEPTAWDLERFDDTMADIEKGALRPSGAGRAMLEVVHACLVSPTQSLEALKKAIPQRMVAETFGFVMKLGGFQDATEGKAQSA